MNLIKTGKSERSLEITEFYETVILFRYSQSSAYQFCWATFTFDSVWTTVSSPKASEGTRNTRENKYIPKYKKTQSDSNTNKNVLSWRK